jgi:hypothetical protein
MAASLVAGGFVIVMRHASSPRTPPTADTAKPDVAIFLQDFSDRIGRFTSQLRV